MKSIAQRIADELGAQEWQVAAATQLLDEGATVPFVARYRKEVTGALDDAQLRTLEERLGYLRELEERRGVILASIREQGKLDTPLQAAIEAADSKARLEDLYLLYKPKRRTRAQIAREAGLEPLAEGLLGRPDVDPSAAAFAFVDIARGVLDPEAALDGARAILVERFAEDAELIGELRETVWQQGRLTARVRPGKETAGAKFSDYFDYAEALTALPSHRILALFRGEKEEVLDLDLQPPPATGAAAATAGITDPFEHRIAGRFGIDPRGRPADRWLAETVRTAWRTKMLLHIQVDLRQRLWQAAEDEAVRVFAGNLRDLLLAAPAGARPTLGLDPGFRTGVKAAVVDATGKVLATATVYPHEPQRRRDEAIEALATLARAHAVDLVAIGNGTASRETDRLVAELIQRHPDLALTRVVVSEAGASVYSASAYASQELPDLDVSLRGAVSIARRLQDPLAELVKIEPRSIGVGQYQHDLGTGRLSRSLDAVVEDCVNAVGVDVNTASPPLLARVSGLGDSLAQNIVQHRDANGPFRTRAALREVPRLGPKAFELSAGFLRIPGGDDPLDASAVHPEAYPVVRRILDATGIELPALIGNRGVLRSLQPDAFTDAAFGVPTVVDILGELEKPGRDPRPEFRTARFRDDVHTLADLEPGMLLEGVVTNVVAFGAFVDVGVHQDGLVHVSALAERFVKDPRAVVKPGDIVRVKVVEVDAARRRIALSMRLSQPAAATREPAAPRDRSQRSPGRGRREQPLQPQPGSAPGATPSTTHGGTPSTTHGGTPSTTHGGTPSAAPAGAGRPSGGGPRGGARTADRGGRSSRPAEGEGALAEALRRAGLHPGGPRSGDPPPQPGRRRP